MAGLLTFQSSPKGSKGIKMANLSVFDHLGPFWAALEPFGPFQTKVDLFAPKHLRQTLLCPVGEKKSFLSEMIQKGPDRQKGPQMVNIWVDHFDPFWTLSDARKCQNQDTLITLTS